MNDLNIEEENIRKIVNNNSVLLHEEQVLNYKFKAKKYLECKYPAKKNSAWKLCNYTGKYEELLYINKNTKKLYDNLNNILSKDDILVEIGSYDGRWTHILCTHVKKIFCCDIIREGYDYFESNFGKRNTEFLLIEKNNKLSNIETNSIDIIFAKNSINRMDKNNFIKAFEEYMRILKKNGKIFIEIGIKEYPGVVTSNFDKLITLNELTNLLLKYNIDTNVIDLKFHDDKRSIVLNNLLNL